VKETFQFFENRGLPLEVEANKRAFPKSRKAVDVLTVLTAYVQAGKVTIMTNSPVTGIEAESGCIEAVLSGSKRYEAESVILATGGFSHPETGSTGDGFGWLRDLGHTVAPPTPSIVPLRTEEAWSHKLAGIAVDDIKITFFAEGKKAFVKKGKVLFTHFGLSGPLILNSASRVADLLQAGKVTAAIDLYPALDLGQMDERVLAAFDNNKNKDFKNAIKELVPGGAAKGILEVLGAFMDTSKKTHSVSREERKLVVNVLKSLPLTISGLMGFDRAVVADGGLLLEEVDMRTMRSRKVSNLFVTGDLLHIKRPSGGYSLQLCWTTGFVAGTHA
jgi:predicted Rossmann fold flavoprotein